MTRWFLIILTIVGLHLDLKACTFATATYTSVQDGNWDAAATWGNTGNDVPGNNDHVIISTGDSVFHNNQERPGRVRVETGGVLYTGGTMRVNESYEINGTHRGDSDVRLRPGNDSILGTGLIQLTADFRTDNPRTIFAGSDLTLQSTNFRLPNNGSVTNNGSITMSGAGEIIGNGSGTLLQQTGSVFTSDAPDPVTGGTLDASATDNLVDLNAAAANQVIPIPASSYYI